MVLLFSYWFGAFIFENTKYLNQFTKGLTLQCPFFPKKFQWHLLLSWPWDLAINERRCYSQKKSEL
jgi:hypothetical protein